MGMVAGEDEAVSSDATTGNGPVSPDQPAEETHPGFLIHQAPGIITVHSIAVIKPACEAEHVADFMQQQEIPHVMTPRIVTAIDEDHAGIGQQPDMRFCRFNHNGIVPVAPGIGKPCPPVTSRVPWTRASHGRAMSVYPAPIRAAKPAVVVENVHECGLSAGPSNRGAVEVLQRK